MRRSSFALCVFVLALLCRLATPFATALPADPLAHGVICAQDGAVPAPAAPDLAHLDEHCAVVCSLVAAPLPPAPPSHAAPLRLVSRVAWFSREGAVVLARIALAQSARGPPVLP